MARSIKQKPNRQPMAFGLITDNPKSGVAEAYRAVRTNIQFYNVGETMRRLLITSAGPGEGKSTTLSNLAITFAQAGNRVIVVDADLRRPYLHRVFQVSNLRGLTNALVGNASLEEVIQGTNVPNLEAITSGPIPPNPSEMLGSTRMRQLLEQLEDHADIVIIDSPPVVAVTDAAVLAQIVDGVILVASAGLVTRDMAQRAKAQLEAVKAKILGVVLNSVEDEGAGYYYYYYYGERK